MKRESAVRIMILVLGLLVAAAPLSHALSLEDQILKRTGQPVFMKDGSRCDCKQFWWLVLAADYIQCDKGTWAKEIPVSEIDLDRTFGKGTADRVERLRAGEEPEKPKTVSLERTTAGMEGSGSSTNRSHQGDTSPRSGDEALQEIADILESSDAEVLAEGLLDLYDRAQNPAASRMIPRLMVLLEDDRRVRYYVNESSPIWTFHKGTGSIAELASACLAHMGRPAVHALHRELDRGRSLEVRRLIYRSLSILQDESSWPRMVQALMQEDSVIGLAACDYFGKKKDSRALPHLQEAFDKAESIRLSVIGVMGEIGDRRAVPFLKEILENSRRSDLRTAAGNSLSKIGGPEASRALERAARPGRHRLEVQEAARKALGETGDSWTLQDLVYALTDGDVSTRKAAARALAELQAPDAARPLARALTSDAEEEVRMQAAMGLFKLQGQDARSALVYALEHETEADIRRTIALGLRKHMHPESVDALARAVLRDPDSNVRMDAMNSIVHMGELGRRATGALQYAVENDPSANNRKTARHFLEAMQ